MVLNYSTTVHVFRHNLTISNIVFFVLLWAILIFFIASEPSSNFSNPFPILFIDSVFQICYFPSHILPQNYFASFASGCLRAFFTSSMVEFYFYILESSVLFELLRSVFVSFNSPFFRQYLLIFLFKLHFTAVLLWFFLPKISLYFSLLSIFTVFCSYFTCFSCVNFHPGFEFLFGLLRRTPILLQAYFAFELITSVNSTILPLG